MEKIINYENLRNFAYSNDAVCVKPIKGVVLSFFGLGGSAMYSEDTSEGLYWAERGIIYIIPYYNPWSWMNRQAVSFTDEILDVIFEKYSLPQNTPVVSTGGSMGGLSALVYTKYAKRTPVACVANCPVCDMVFHYTERADLPRTIYSAFWGVQGSLEKALQSASPFHLVPQMPKVKYHIFHCDADTAVNIDSHSRKFVAAMTEKNYEITFDIVKGKGHCDLTDEMKEKFTEYIFSAIKSYD